MIELIITLFIIYVVLLVFFYGFIFFSAGIAYAYWGLSIIMAPISWIFMIVGMIVGLLGAVKNAVKAIKAVKMEKNNNE